MHKASHSSMLQNQSVSFSAIGDHHLPVTSHDDGEAKIARRSNHLPQLALRSSIQTLHQTRECESLGLSSTTLPTVVGSSRNTSDGLPMNASAALTFLLFPPLRTTMPSSLRLPHTYETLPQALHPSMLVHLKTEELQHVLTHGGHLRRLHTFQSRGSLASRKNIEGVSGLTEQRAGAFRRHSDH